MQRSIRTAALRSRRSWPSSRAPVAAMGPASAIAGWRLTPGAAYYWLGGAEVGFAPRRRAGCGMEKIIVTAFSPFSSNMTKRPSV